MAEEAVTLGGGGGGGGGALSESSAWLYRVSDVLSAAMKYRTRFVKDWKSLE